MIIRTCFSLVSCWRDLQMWGGHRFAVITRCHASLWQCLAHLGLVKLVMETQISMTGGLGACKKCQWKEPWYGISLNTLKLLFCCPWQTPVSRLHSQSHHTSVHYLYVQANTAALPTPPYPSQVSASLKPLHSTDERHIDCTHYEASLKPKCTPLHN